MQVQERNPYHNFILNETNNFLAGFFKPAPSITVITLQNRVIQKQKFYCTSGNSISEIPTLIKNKKHMLILCNVQHTEEETLKLL